MLKPPSFDLDLKKLNDKDRPTIGLLFREYYEPLLAIAGKFLPNNPTAEDIVMEVFKSLMENTNLHFEEVSHVPGKLVTMTVNRCRTYVSRNRYYPYDPVYFQEITDRGVAPVIFRKYIIWAISGIIDKMTPRQRQILELRADEELTLERIADILGLSVSTVHEHIAKARRIIAGKLQQVKWNYSWILLLLFLILIFFQKN